MGYKTRGSVVAIIKEDEFNQGGTFTDNDVVEITGDTTLKPEVDSVERKATSSSFLGKPKMPGKEFGSGTIGVELIPGYTAGTLMGDKVLEVALGVKSEAGTGTGAFIGYESDGTTVANKISKPDPDKDGTAVLYTLSKPCGAQPSLAIKQMFGCSTDDSQSLVFTGVVPNSTKIDLPVADIGTITFDIGAAGFNTASGETLLVQTPTTLNPFVGKNAKFIVGGATMEAKDLSFSIDNTVSDREAITSSGITTKEVTAKAITGSLTVTFENWDELNKYKNAEFAEVYLEMEANGKKFALYFPRVSYTSVSVEDDDGILANKIEFEATEDPVTNEAIFVAFEV